MGVSEDGTEADREAYIAQTAVVVDCAVFAPSGILHYVNLQETAGSNDSDPRKKENLERALKKADTVIVLTNKDIPASNVRLFRLFSLTIQSANKRLLKLAKKPNFSFHVVSCTEVIFTRRIRNYLHSQAANRSILSEILEEKERIRSKAMKEKFIKKTTNHLQENKIDVKDVKMLIACPTLCAWIIKSMTSYFCNDLNSTGQVKPHDEASLKALNDLFKGIEISEFLEVLTILWNLSLVPLVNELNEIKESFSIFAASFKETLIKNQVRSHRDRI